MRGGGGGVGGVGGPNSKPSIAFEMKRLFAGIPDNLHA